MRDVLRRPLLRLVLAGVLLVGTVVSRAAGVAAANRGHLVLLGGGPTPEAIFTRALDLSGGRSASVAVLPQTYPNDSMGEAAVAMWRSLGVRDVVMVSRTDAAAAQAALERATLIWIPGGFQGVFMKAIAGTAIRDVVRRRFAAGVTVGGSSAGAAAVSQVMIADETTPDGVGIDGPLTVEGLGLWPAAIVSPHFTERRRLNGLVTIMRSHPSLVGVGIDEGTAVIVADEDVEVMGRGSVTIVDDAGRAPRTLRAGAHVRIAGISTRR
jgi:cyanophycinase